MEKFNSSMLVMNGQQNNKSQKMKTYAENIRIMVKSETQVIVFEKCDRNFALFDESTREHFLNVYNFNL